MPRQTLHDFIILLLEKLRTTADSTGVNITGRRNLTPTISIVSLHIPDMRELGAVSVPELEL
jgi:hypothetical protein